MTEFTSHKHGEFSWIEQRSGDAAKAKAFYEALFGLDSRTDPIGDGMEYTTMLKGGKQVWGLFELSGEMANLPPHFASYVTVDDIEASLAQAEALGGTVVVPAQELPDEGGKAAGISDPQGSMLGLYEADKQHGAEIANEHGTLDWNELITTDTAAAADFYGALFGWEAHEMEDAPMTYYLLQEPGHEEGEAVRAGLMERRPDMGDIPPYWGVYISVDNVDATAAKAEELGGQNTAAPFDVPGVGRMAGITDPTGAFFMVSHSAQQS